MVMSFVLFHSFVFLLFICVVWCAPTQKEIDALLWDHNNARRTLANPVANNMLLMKWDPILAQVAQNYLNKLGSCASFSHNPDPTKDYLALGGQNGNQVGENWYSGQPSNASDPSGLFGGAVKAWTDGGCRGYSVSGGKYTCTSTVCSEMSNFYKTNGCSSGFSGVGHFTQVMWADSEYVGCGTTSSCGTLCNYAPAGNYGSPTKPTDVWGVGGAAASACPSFAPYNDNGLCSRTQSSNNPSTDSPATSPATNGGTTNAPSGTTTTKKATTNAAGGVSTSPSSSGSTTSTTPKITSSTAPLPTTTTPPAGTKIIRLVFTGITDPNSAVFQQNVIVAVKLSMKIETDSVYVVRAYTIGNKQYLEIGIRPEVKILNGSSSDTPTTIKEKIIVDASQSDTDLRTRLPQLQEAQDPEKTDTSASMSVAVNFYWSGVFIMLFSIFRWM